MFRKVSKKRKPSSNKSRIRSDDDDDEADYAETTSIHHRIQQTQKKHKLLASLPIATGEGADKPGKKSRFFQSSSAGESSSSSLAVGDAQQDMSVLAQKHQQAMEEFIKAKMDPSTNQEEAKKSSKTTTSTSSIDPETALYQELAASTVPSQILNPSADDDKDAKGAMLVGGTGIAEVILPKAVEFNNSKKNSAGIRYSRNPQLSSAVGGGASSSKTDSNLLPAGFRSMVPSNKDQPEDPTPDATYKHSASATNEPTPSTKNKAEVDESRPGFAARYSSRKGGNATSGAAATGTATTTTTTRKPRGKQYQRDQEVFSKFVKRQRASGKR